MPMAVREAGLHRRLVGVAALNSTGVPTVRCAASSDAWASRAGVRVDAHAAAR